MKRLIKPGILPVARVIDMLVSNPRKILNLPVPEIKAGNKANLTLFNTDEEWNYTPDQVRSKSKNSPYIGETLTGRSVAVYNKGRFSRSSLRN